MRFTGSVEPLAPVDVAPLVEWISAIDLNDWPQQNPPGSELKPAMVTDLAWHGFGEMVRPTIDALMTAYHPGWFHWSGPKPNNAMLSVVMPGHNIPSHRDEMGLDWLCRVHVPLVSNAAARFVVNGALHVMKPGLAYKVNVLAKHSVENAGPTPRIHFMFDVGSH